MPRTKPPAASQVSEGITLEDALIKWGDPGSVQEFMTLEAEGYDGRHGLLLWFPELPRSVREKKTLQSLKLREQLKTQILGKLQRGELVAIAYDSRAPLDGDPVIIPADRWRVLKANFHESSARGENFAVTGILVYQGKPLGSPKAARRPGKVAPAKLWRWYRLWIDRNEAAGNIPSRDDDWKAAKAECGDGVTRQTIQDLRAKLAPPPWRKQGRRKLTK
jgi:hypothetical protein